MPDLFPFPGLRYHGVAPDGDLAAVTAPPYDVIDEEGRARLIAAHPHNAVQLILPRDVEPGDRYRRAAATFEQWRADGTLTADAPHLYAYRMAFTDPGGPGEGGAGISRRMTGVVGALALSPPGAGSVLPHERTMPKAKSDRLELLRAVRANLEPIWGLSLAGGLSELIEPVIEAGRPAASCFDEGGAEHCLFPIDAGRVAAIQAAVADAALVIADGHHRYETALAYQDERRAAGLDDPGADRIMMLVVELAEDQLVVRPIHRLLSGLGADFRNRLSQVCQVVPLGPTSPSGVRSLVAEMDQTGSMGLVHDAGLALLTVKPAALAAELDTMAEPLRNVDSARLDAVFERVGAPAEIEYRNDAVTVAGLVAKGAAEAAVLLRAVSVAQIEAVAEAGLRMPQKTTFFQPKPLTGLVFRSLDLG